jgi:hypothetical protein
MADLPEWAAHRPPDRIYHGPWEPPPELPFDQLRHRLVATQASLFKVLEYTRVVDDPRPLRRKHIEVWERPAWREYVYPETALALTNPDHSLASYSIEVVDHPSERWARFTHWESMGSECADD